MGLTLRISVLLASYPAPISFIHHHLLGASLLAMSFMLCHILFYMRCNLFALQ